MQTVPALRVEDFTVRRLNYSSNPWRVVHVASDRQVSIPRQIINDDGNAVRFRGAAAFPTKRAALAWTRDELPNLLAAAATTVSA